jgi:CHAD domain-containing protein
MTLIDRTVDENLKILFSMLPAVRDGNADAIHDARVATRRLRAAAPLACEEGSDEPLEAIRTLGRSFGRARDLDVAIERLGEVERRLPAIARSLASLKQTLTARQEKSRRRLIKTIEDLPLEAIETLRPARPVMNLRRDRRHQPLQARIVEQVSDLRQAIDRASGVYFPNRTHEVRISAKKLRYLLELLPDRQQPNRALKRLRRVQELLGRLHDDQTLADVIEETRDGSTDREPYDQALALVDADRRDRFAEYLGQRETLTQTVDEIMKEHGGHVSRKHVVARGLLLAGVVLVPSAASLVRGMGGRNPKRHTSQLSSAHAYAASGTSSSGSGGRAAVTAAPPGAEHHGAAAGERARR